VASAGTRSSTSETQEPGAALEPSKLDVAVLLIFFCRPQQFGQVFEQVRIARPSRLYLYQDGPRAGRSGDMDGIQLCRKIAGEIDWECEVHTLYQEENLGCDPSEYIAQKWMFQTEEAGIILEDDDVPSQSFFPFCRELLEKYKDDERIDRICGMNNTGVSEHVASSYLFAKTGSIWGWATWRRVLDTWDPCYSWLDDESALARLRVAFDRTGQYGAFLETARRHRSTGVPHYESIGGFACHSDGRLLIVPKYNLISSVGASEESTHSSELWLLPRRTRMLFFMERHELEFPLTHPQHVIRDTTFERAMTLTRPQQFYDKLERLLLLLWHEGIVGTWKRLPRLRHQGQGQS
jgi:hypothetical protein